MAPGSCCAHYRIGVIGMINLLSLSTLYPNAERPTFGIFVETRIIHLVTSGLAATRVIAPVPILPMFSAFYQPSRTNARVPEHERREHVDVYHPRYAHIPKVSMSTDPFSLYAVVLPAIRRMLCDGLQLDIIDAHYFYPDGVAAVLLGRALHKPVVITGRGTDLMVFPRYWLPRQMIRWAALRAAGVVTVSRALRDRLVQLGVGADRIRVFRNGVDLERFRPNDRIGARQKLGLSMTTLLSVGNLVRLKGHDLVIGALQHLPNTELLIVGEGPEDGALRRLASKLGVESRVRFVGRLAQSALPEIYEAADVLVLASSREGWPNVLLEAMACGTPVIATNVGGISECVTRPEVGELIAARTPAGIAAAVVRLLERRPNRDATRRYAEAFSWDETTAGQIDLFQRILDGSGRH